MSQLEQISDLFYENRYLVWYNYQNLEPKVETLMDTIAPILEKMRPLIAPLNAEERLALIQAIAEMTTESEKTIDPGDTNRHQQIAVEQAAWFKRPLTERQQFRGEFVALRDGAVIDHDHDQRTLYLRIKSNFGRAPIAILNANLESTPQFTIHSPSLVTKSSKQIGANEGQSG